MYFEIVEALEDYCSDLNDEERIRFLSECGKYIGERGEVFFYKLREHLQEDALDKHLCPSCLSHLTYEDMKESRGEHFGRPTYEAMLIMSCNDCGWREEY